METKEEFLAELSRCVVEMEDDDISAVAEDYAAMDMLRLTVFLTAWSMA